MHDKPPRYWRRKHIRRDVIILDVKGDRRGIVKRRRPEVNLVGGKAKRRMNSNTSTTQPKLSEGGGGGGGACV